MYINYNNCAQVIWQYWYIYKPITDWKNAYWTSDYMISMYIYNKYTERLLFNISYQSEALDASPWLNYKIYDIYAIYDENILCNKIQDIDE